MRCPARSGSAMCSSVSDDAVFEEQKKCRIMLQKLNFMDRADFAGISALVKELFGSSDGAFLNPPFYCDYGSHIHVGKNFFANYNYFLQHYQLSFDNDITRFKL